MDTGRRYDLDDYHALVPAMTWLCAQIADSTGDEFPPFAMFTQLANTEKENKRLKQLLAEERASLTAQSHVSPITIPELLPAKSPSKTVATLCRLPFTPADLQALLQFLKLLDSNGNNITTELQSRNRSRWGKFTAAYRVLQRNSLMETTTDDVEWATAFEIAYKAKHN